MQCGIIYCQKSCPINFRKTYSSKRTKEKRVIICNWFSRQTVEVDEIDNEKSEIKIFQSKSKENLLSMTPKTKLCASEKQYGSKDPFVIFMRSAKKL